MGADRELDALLCEALQCIPGVPEARDIGVCDATEEGLADGQGWVLYYRDAVGAEMMTFAPRVTASADDAKALAVDAGVEYARLLAQSRGHCEMEFEDGSMVAAIANTMPLAIIAAALTALIAQAEKAEVVA